MLFWDFLFYSFGGYLLEKWFAKRTGAEKQTRKGLILLPLCPVYGLAMATVLALPAPARVWPWLPWSPRQLAQRWNTGITGRAKKY